MIREIHLDMDDVLNTFTMPLLRSFGAACTAFGYGWYPKEAGYDFCEAIRLKLDPEFKSTLQSIWTDYPTLVQLFRDVPKSEECDKLVEWAIDQVGADRVFLLTKPVPDPLCYYYKALWIRGNLPTALWGQMVTHPCKYLIGDDCRLLIDDSWLNIERWQGPRMCLGRPWNHSTYTVDDIVSGNARDINLMHMAGKDDS